MSASSRRLFNARRPKVAFTCDACARLNGTCSTCRAKAESPLTDQLLRAINAPKTTKGTP